MFDRIPSEMRLYPQWVCWRYEEQEDGAKPTKVPYSPTTGAHADVKEPSSWSTYEQAVHAATTHSWYSGIGFVLTDNDPFTIIDLDNPYQVKANGQAKNDNAAEIMARQQQVFAETSSYAERSPSGTGLHIIVKGSVPSGRKRSEIEIYSNLRYMTMTGDVYRDAPINDEHDFANVLWSRIGEGKKAVAMFAGLEAAKYQDEEILRIASTAANAEKFNDLFYGGNWQKYYPSQSEADFALVDMIAFYSENRSQVKKIFLTSKLAEREKSRADYRINYMLNRCFDRMLPPVDIEGLRNSLTEALEAKRPKPDAMPTPAPSQETPLPSMPKATSNVYSVPPGLVGEIAQFIYAQAPRPVPEIALAGALGLVAGIVGRAYNISGTGLNQYVLLLAPTGTGKESIAGGIDKLIAEVVRTVPAAIEYIGPAKISSEQALTKYMSKTSASFVSVVGEFGITLKMMSSPFAPPHMQGLLGMFLDLYNKSGEGKVMRPTIYSDREKNTLSILSPSFTMVGESTPESFYGNLDESMITSGLLPRFTAIEYHGDRPPLNPSHMFARPSFELIEKLATLCANALQLNSQNKAIHVGTDEQAKRLFEDFDKHCDTNINSSDREVKRHLWNRAHIKALKLAGLIAVGLNPYDPVISSDVATWAINLIVADVRNLLNKFDAGEIGIDNDETKQLAKVMECFKDYITKPWSDVQKYSTSPVSLHSEKIVPYSYLSRRLAAVAVFRKDKRGSGKALEAAVRLLCDRGDVAEVSRATLSKDHGTTAKAYMVSSLKAFGL